MQRFTLPDLRRRKRRSFHPGKYFSSSNNFPRRFRSVLRDSINVRKLGFHTEVSLMNRSSFEIENMESRLFLDASATLNSRGVFVVTGTDAAETIEITYSADGTNVQANLGGSLLGEAAVADVR